MLYFEIAAKGPVVQNVASVTNICIKTIVSAKASSKARSLILVE